MQNCYYSPISFLGFGVTLENIAVSEKVKICSL